MIAVVGDETSVCSCGQEIGGIEVALVQREPMILSSEFGKGLWFLVSRQCKSHGWMQIGYSGVTIGSGPALHLVRRRNTQ